MDLDLIIKNVDKLAGLNGVKGLLDCIWCINGKRDKVLEFIANRYGFVDLPNKSDSKKLPSLMKAPEVLPSASSDKSVKMKLARKYGVSPSKVKPAGKGRFIIRGRIVLAEEVG